MEKIMSSFNAKKFNLYNKDLDNKEEIGKMLVNYKWSYAHLLNIDEAYAKVAQEQFVKMVKQYNVKLEAPKKAEKNTK